MHALRGGKILDPKEIHDQPDALISAVGEGINTVVIACQGSTDFNVESSGKTVEKIAADSMAIVETLKLIIERELKVKVYVLTSFAGGPEVKVPDGTGASLWGITMSLMAEQPMIFGGMLDSDLNEQSVKLVCGMIGGGNGQPFGAIRNGTYFVQRLAHIVSHDSMPPIQKNATYLITGGSGALGLFTANWLAEKGAGLYCSCKSQRCQGKCFGTT